MHETPFIGQRPLAPRPTAHRWSERAAALSSLHLVCSICIPFDSQRFSEEFYIAF